MTNIDMFVYHLHVKITDSSLKINTRMIYILISIILKIERMTDDLFTYLSCNYISMHLIIPMIECD